MSPVMLDENLKLKMQSLDKKKERKAFDIINQLAREYLKIDQHNFTYFYNWNRRLW